jgi:hypothetical protein
MAKVTGYEVLVDELTVHRTVSELKNPLTGEVTGHVSGLGDTYYFGEVISPELVSQNIKDAFDEGEGSLFDQLSKKLKPVTDAPQLDVALRLGLPFDGYDDLTEDEVLAAMANLPSQAQMRIKEYEAGNENRARITRFNIGFGENSLDRQAGKIASEVDVEGREAAAGKPAARLKTRNIPDEGPVEPGEGYTGTGDPVIPYGTSEDDSDDSEEEKKKSGLAAQRRGRRPRAASAKKAADDSANTEESTEDDSDEQS